VIVAGNVAPTENGKAFGLNLLSEQFFARAANGCILRQEENADPIVPAGRQIEFQPVGLGGEERVGNLNEDSGTIARRFVSAGGAAVLQIQQNLLGVCDNFVTFRPGNIDYRPDAAGIVLVLRVVKSLRRRGGSHRFLPQKWIWRFRGVVCPVARDKVRRTT
jgi:hypothetical protein